MRAVALPSFSNQFQRDAENTENNEINARKKRFEQAFAERNLWPFVSDS